MGQDDEFDRKSAEHSRALLPATLREIRKRKKMSQGDVAAKMGVHRNTIARMETRPETVDHGLVVGYCEALGEPAWKVLKFVHAPRTQHEAKQIPKQ